MELVIPTAPMACGGVATSTKETRLVTSRSPLPASSLIGTALPRRLAPVITTKTSTALIAPAMLPCIALITAFGRVMATA